MICWSSLHPNDDFGLARSLKKAGASLNPGWRPLNIVAEGRGADYFSRMKLILMTFALFSFVNTRTSAQTPPARLDPSMVGFFIGEWKGAGAFANGRPIQAVLSFRLSLDSAWLVSEHADVPPNGYKST